MIDVFSLLIFLLNLNSLGIILEIMGIIFIVKSAKPIRRKEGVFEGTEYIDIKSGQPADVLTIEDSKLIKMGIGLTILGLILQLFQ